MNGSDREYCPVCTYPVAYPPTIRRPVICETHIAELRTERRQVERTWRGAQCNHAEWEQRRIQAEDAKRYR